MPPGKMRKKEPVASFCGSGGIDAVPDGVLEHILGFVPAEEAVRTCVLARRWRHLWKSATGLRIMCDARNLQQVGSRKEPWEFVDHLLRLRGHAPLEMFELRFSHFHDDDDELRLNRWLRHVMVGQVQMLRLENIGHDGFELDDLPLVSRHLTKIELVGIDLNDSFCDFSGCPSLEHLVIDTCYLLSAKKISSESLKRLSMTSCDLGREFRTLIHVPNLASLRLDSHLSRAPVFESMPSLQEAFVRVTHENAYTWDCDDYSGDCDDEDCYSCHGIIDDNNKCVFLESLSEAQNLAFLSESLTFIFERDLKHCPTFSKLKTLLLDDHWCVAPDFPALNCILKNAPVLEKLTLQLFSKGPKHKVEMIGRYHPTDRSAGISEHLKAIEVKCKLVGEEVHKVLKFLCTFDICKVSFSNRHDK
ncbi:hypothetical protein ACP70R_045274 [Stipagrostis hirtigluma subsp. patula]